LRLGPGPTAARRRQSGAGVRTRPGELARAPRRSIVTAPNVAGWDFPPALCPLCRAPGKAMRDEHPHAETDRAIHERFPFRRVRCSPRWRQPLWLGPPYRCRWCGAQCPGDNCDDPAPGVCLDCFTKRSMRLVGELMVLADNGRAPDNVPEWLRRRHIEY